MDGAKPGETGIFDDWMTRAELADEMKVSVDSLARWESRRTGPPCVRVGRRILYRREAVREWLVSQEKRATRGGR